MRFLEFTDNNFLTQVIKEMMREDNLLDLTLAKKEGLVKDEKVRGSLSCADHEMVKPKDMVILMYKKLNMSQKCAFAAKKVNFLLSYIRKNISSTSREVILSTYTGEPHLECWIYIQVLQYKRHMDLLE